MATETQIRTTRVFEANCESWLSGKRRSFNEGGTSSSKTYSILQLLVLIAAAAKEPFLCSVVSESIPHLKRGCIRDFMSIMGPQFDYTKWNATNFIYTFGKGTIEFFPADEPSKMRGGRRDILFINEANNVTYEAYRELDIRTRLHGFFDWNPVSEFWYHEERLRDHPENTYIHSTFLDCLDVLPAEVVANIESNRDRDPNWWAVYGLGLLGKIEGLVYPHFELCDTLPQNEPVYGLDFGYSNDPTVLVKNVMRDGVLFSQELIYETGLTNQNIARKMYDAGVHKNSDEIFADCAEPKSIQEIAELGFNIKPCPKGADSVEFGHQKVRQFKQFWTKDSLRAIKEQRNFRYLMDANGKFTEKTNHHFSHSMDARRYAVMGHSLDREVSIRWI